MRNTRLIALVLVMLLLGSTALAATPSIKGIKYKGDGKIEVDFKRDVQYSNVKVEVVDSSGKKYTVKIKDKDEDDIIFQVKSLKAGTRYKYRISGIRSGGTGSYTSVIGSFTTSGSKSTSSSVSIRSVDYDVEDKDIDINFSGLVQYKSVKVTVRDSSGKSYQTSIRNKDSDDMEVRVSGLKYGSKYTVSVSGVGAKGSGKYGTISKSFTAK